MTRWFASVIVAVLVALPALGQTVKVSSGDHPDFTRIVVEYAGPADWTMGRTPDGYELRQPGGPIAYDLSKVFDLIGKDRLAAIWADPQNGALHLSIACACFAMPFEFRPGTVVIDIRNGPPPKGSSFELSLDGGAAVELAGRPTIRPLKRPFPTTPAPTPAPMPAPMPETGTASPPPVYDWTAAVPGGSTDHALSGDLLDRAAQDTAQLDLEPLRQSLIEQLSRGASEGIVDMAKPGKTSAEAEGSGNPSVAIRLGDAPNLVVRQKGQADAPMTAKGARCIPQEMLDVGAWADETPVSGQIGPVMSGLTGEFDVPNPEAVKNAVRFYLSIGFGAEARALLRALPSRQEDAGIWQSMAHILDSEPDPQPAFAGMAACDTPAALWAVLADPDVLAVGQVEKSAILRAFSALPNRLRRQLGPVLVDRFLAMEDFGTAISLRDTTLRGISDPGPEFDLMQAAIEHAGGSPGASEAILEVTASESGPEMAAALVALVTLRAEMGQEVSFLQVQSLEGFAKERQGSPDEAEFNHALTLAYAASGDFTSAFGRVDDDPGAAPTLWKILANAGSDSALLDHATLNDPQAPPSAATSAASLVATRMLDLGLSDQAARWLGLAEAPPTLLAARVQLAEGQAQAALDLLGDDQSPAALPIRVAALRDLGDEKALADLFAAAGMTEEQWSSISRMQDWQSLAASGPAVWQQAARTLIEPPAADGATAQNNPTNAVPSAAVPMGPLAQSQELLVSSKGTRDAITALLNAVKSPTVLKQ